MAIEKAKRNTGNKQIYLIAYMKKNVLICYLMHVKLLMQNFIDKSSVVSEMGILIGKMRPYMIKQKTDLAIAPWFTNCY